LTRVDASPFLNYDSASPSLSSSFSRRLRYVFGSAPQQRRGDDGAGVVLNLPQVIETAEASA
jgi:hypothetical protein